MIEIVKLKVSNTIEEYFYKNAIVTDELSIGGIYCFWTEEDDVYRESRYRINQEDIDYGYYERHHVKRIIMIYDKRNK